jgi:hypothetical protein
LGADWPNHPPHPPDSRPPSQASSVAKRLALNRHGRRVPQMGVNPPRSGLGAAALGRSRALKQVAPVAGRAMPRGGLVGEVGGVDLPVGRVRRVAVLRCNALGDYVMATPALAALRQAFRRRR